MLQDLVKSILEDGRIDADEVATLREAIFADGKVDKEEADALFTLNDAVSESGNFDPSFKDLFVEAVSSYVLADAVSPGVVDADNSGRVRRRLFWGSLGRCDSGTPFPAGVREAA